MTITDHRHIYLGLLNILTLLYFETSVATDKAGQVFNSVFVFPTGTVCPLMSYAIYWVVLTGTIYIYLLDPHQEGLAWFLSAGAIVLRGFLFLLSLSRSWVIARGRIPWLISHDELAVCYFLVEFSSWLDNSLVPVVSGEPASLFFILILYLWTLLVRVGKPSNFYWVYKEYCVFQFSQWN